MLRHTQILGSGVYIPKRKVTAAEIDARIGAKPGTCANKTGVQQRFFVDIENGESAAEMGARAAEAALVDAELNIADIDAIVCASNTRDQPLPGMGPRYHKFLCGKKSTIPAFDIHSTCLSFVTALDTVSYMLAAGRFRRVLIISSEVGSIGVDWSHVESACLFGDGAVAFVVGQGDRPEAGVLAAAMETHSDCYEYCEAAGGGILNPPWNYSPEIDKAFRFKMDGRNLFKAASKSLGGFLDRLLSEGHCRMDDLRLVVPHQASMSGLRIMRRKLGIPEDRFYINVHERGNLVAASIPTCLHEARNKGLITSGDLVMMIGTSAGVSLGGLILRL